MASAASMFAGIGSVSPPAGVPARLGTAVVLGGSVAGLLAARVLADHADRVLIIERDADPAPGGPRPGVPQGSQVHALLPGGGRQLERWFPGYTGEAVARGALLAAPGDRTQWIDGVAKVRGCPVDLLCATRPFLEGEIRRRVRDLPGVSVVAGRVTGLDFDGNAVTEVRYEAGGTTVRREAEFVVDATGRSSRVGDWLRSAGWDAPVLTRQIAGINYATVFFRRGPDLPPCIAGLAQRSAKRSGDLAGAAFSAVEDDRWIVMMAGFGPSRPGADIADFVRRCHDDFPAEFGRLASNDPVGDVVTYRQADSRRRDWLDAGRYPARLVAVGDAVASFNPLYGQGMTSAALHASCLALFLRSGDDLGEPARAFFALQRVVVDAAWGMSTGGDLTRPSVTAPKPRGYRATSWLTGQIIAASVTDPVLSRLFDEVAFMLRHPSELARPRVVARALRTRKAI
jgi:2-polyprenyl-6-methoxyphenol hydroxylase-like FAD-dependent oxidoreductase